MTADSPQADEYNYEADGYWRCGRADDCGLPAGWGTDHTGVGACKLHGGSGGAPMQHGIYSDVVREEDREVLDRLEDIHTAQKLEETLNLQLMKLRRAVELTENPDDDRDFWTMFENLVASAAETDELDPRLVRELSKMVQAPGRTQRELMDLIRKTAKDLHKIRDGETVNVQHGADGDDLEELKSMADDLF
jgi:hypothetical protein